MKLFKNIKDKLFKKKDNNLEIEEKKEEALNESRADFICDCPICGKGIFNKDLNGNTLKIPKRGKDSKLYHKKCGRYLRKQAHRKMENGVCDLDKIK